MKRSNSVEFGMFSKNQWINLLILSLVSSSTIWIATKKYDVGVSPDSVNYLTVTKELMGGNNTNLTISPPFYPAILAVISNLFKIDPLYSARILNIVVFGLVILVSGVIYKKYLGPSLIFNIIGIGSVIISIPLIPVFLMAWTEPLFILFVLLYLVFFDLYIRKGSKVFLLFTSLSVALACLTRYIGVVLIFSGVISIVILNKNQIKSIIIDAFGFVVFSAIPIALWLIRNYLISGTFTGPRAISTHSFYQNIRSMLSNILGWYFPGRLQNLYIFAVIFLIIGFLIGIYYVDIWIKRKPNLSWQTPFIILIAIYTIFLVASSKTSFQQLIDSRYLSPIFIPLNLLLLSYIQELIKPLGSRFGKKKTNLILFVIISLWVIIIGRQTGNTLLNHFNYGNSFTSKSWRNSETIEYFDNNLTNCTVYSNGMDVIQFLTDKNVYSTPLKTSGASVVATLSTLKNEWPKEDNVCVVWFDQITWRKYYFTPDELMSVTKLQDEVRLNDGAIYFLSKIK